MAFTRGLRVRKDAVGVTGGDWLGIIREGFAGAWQRGIVEEPRENILKFSAVYACVSLIANDISKLEMLLMQEDAKGAESEVDNSPFLAVLQKPNSYQTRVQFINYWLTCKLLYGNAYIVKQRDNRGGVGTGVVTDLHVLDPRRVVPLVTDDGGVYYQIGADRLAGYVQGAPAVPASEIIHDRMSCLWHPLVGISPIYACGFSATQGIRIQENSAKFFENMSRPGGQLTAPGKITQEAADRIKKVYEDNFSGSNIGRLLVSGDGLKYEPMTMPATDSQLIEQQNWTVQDVARAFHMPLYKIQAPTQPSTATVPAMDQGYFSQTLQIHVEAIECLLTEGLSLPSNYCVEFDESGLSRMDPLSRMQMYQAGMGASVLASNDCRKMEGLPSVAGGDSPMAQQQNYSLAALAKRDALADPFSASKPQAPAAPEVRPIAPTGDAPPEKNFNVYEGEYFEDAIEFFAAKCAVANLMPPTAANIAAAGMG